MLITNQKNRKVSDQMDSPINSMKPLKENITPILLKLLHKIESKSIIPKLSYKAFIALIIKLDIIFTS